MSLSSYQEQLRIRVSGLLVRDNALLLAKIHSPVSDELVWIPPGGGLEYGESMRDCLKREFKEEAGIDVEPGPLWHVNEMIKPPYHAIEFYFEVDGKDEEAGLGFDPEHSEEDQILKELKFIPFGQFGSYPIEPEYIKVRFPNDFRSGSPEEGFSPQS